LQAIRIPCRIIETIYGSGNFDDAGDALITALRNVSDYPSDQYRYHFEFDSAHPNPWYHMMVFKIENIPDPTYAKLVEQVTALGLVENAGPNIAFNPDGFAAA
jgi:hypothetical protein